MKESIYLVAKCCGGPGYASPLDAMHLSSHEELIYMPCIVPNGSRPDYVATVDVEPKSPTFCKVSKRGHS